MGYLKQLDDVLGFLDDGDRPAMAFLSIQRKFKDILDIHLELILDKLCDDGYAGKSKGAFPNYWITYNGLMFLGADGYTGQANRERWKRLRDKFQYWVVVVAASAAGTYSVIELLKMLCNLFYSCSY